MSNHLVINQATASWASKDVGVYIIHYQKGDIFFLLFCKKGCAKNRVTQDHIRMFKDFITEIVVEALPHIYRH